MPYKPIGTPKAFIVHHTGGRGTVQGVLDTLKQRHLGVQYVMDRDGTIYETGGPGASQMMTGWGEKGSGLSNANTVGMEVIAKDDSDVTPAQVAAARRFLPEVYPGIPVYGHGQVNPGHKQATEGMTIVNALAGLPPPTPGPPLEPPALRHVGGAGTSPDSFAPAPASQSPMMELLSLTLANRFGLQQQQMAADWQPSSLGEALITGSSPLAYMMGVNPNKPQNFGQALLFGGNPLRQAIYGGLNNMLSG